MAKTSEDRRLHRYLVWFPEQYFQLVKDSPCLVGRLPECDIRVPSSSVSRTHAQIFWSDVGVELRDMGSTNGTFVNGERVSRRMLNSEDAIRIGGREITFLLASGIDSGQSFARTRQMRQSHVTQALDVDEMTRRPGGFAGSLEDVGIPELVQVMQLTRKSGLIRVYIGQREARLWLRDGGIISASFDALEGEEAFYKLFPHRVGLFEFRPMEYVDRPPTIAMGTPSLLVSAFQRTPYDAVGEADQETSALPAEEEVPPPLVSDAVGTRELSADTGEFPAVDEEEQDRETKMTSLALEFELEDAIAGLDFFREVEAAEEAASPPETETDGDETELIALPESVLVSEPGASPIPQPGPPEEEGEGDESRIDLAVVATAAYVQMVFEQVVSPLLHEHQIHLANHVVRSKMGPGSITILLSGDDAESSSARSWLLIEVGAEHVAVTSDVGVAAQIDGRPEPYELTRPLRVAMAEFVAAVTAASG